MTTFRTLIGVAVLSAAAFCFEAFAQQPAGSTYWPASSDQGPALEWKRTLAEAVVADAAANGTTRYEELPLTIFLTTTNPPIVKGYGTNGTCLTYFFESVTGAGAAPNAAVGTNQQLYAKFTLPGGWVEGTAVTPRIHWAQTVTNGMPGTAGTLTASNVVWGVEYVWLANGVAPTVTTLDYLTNAVSKTNWQHQVSSFTPITNATAKVYDEILFRFSRRGTNVYNTYTNDVAYIKAGVSVRVNATGSTTATTK
jgi:hypothetical protein